MCPLLYTNTKISCSSRRVRFPFLHFLITDCLEQSSVLYSHLYTCKKATSVIGKTSGRSKTNIKYICAVHSPMLTNEEVIEEMLKLAKQIAAAQKEGDKLGLTADELAFYDALTKPQAIKDFYENDELIAITKELADTLRKNKTIDWQKRESARAKMRMLIKKLLKKHKYPPEGMEDAVQTVIRWKKNQYKDIL